MSWRCFTHTFSFIHRPLADYSFTVLTTTISCARSNIPYTNSSYTSNQRDYYFPTWWWQWCSSDLQQPTQSHAHTYSNLRDFAYLPLILKSLSTCAILAALVVLSVDIDFLPIRKWDAQLAFWKFYKATVGVGESHNLGHFESCLLLPEILLFIVDHSGEALTSPWRWSSSPLFIWRPQAP